MAGRTARDTPSYEKVHFVLRPAKNVERKMLAEAFQRLALIDRLESYRYVGFGSIYFADFSLFHRTLGIRDLISIERADGRRARFKANRPFKCIDIKLGESTAVLPALGWQRKTILWLDYDDVLMPYMLMDIQSFCARAAPGSVLLVTVDAREGPYSESDTRLDRLAARLGRERLPAALDEEHLAGWGTASVYRDIIDGETQANLAARNAARDPDSRLTYRQLFNFHYADTSKMLTVGGIIYDLPLAHKVQECAFEQIPFVREGPEHYAIETPNLTYRELHRLASQLPCDDPSKLKAPGVPLEDKRRYARLYRYYPTFAEADV